jgi:hypothetical protein
MPEIGRLKSDARDPAPARFPKLGADLPVTAE